MLAECFKYYQDIQKSSYSLFSRQNSKEHSDLLTDFIINKKGEFRLLINHFLCKLQSNNPQTIKENLSAIYIFKNQYNQTEVYFTENKLLKEPKINQDIQDITYTQFYNILLQLSGLNVQDTQENILRNNYLDMITKLYTVLIKVNQKEQKKGNIDLQLKFINVKAKNTLILQPNGDILQLPKINKESYNCYLTSLYISQRVPQFDLFNDQQPESQYLYKGQIDKQLHLPNGQGSLNCFQQYEFNGNFKDGLASGQGKLLNFRYNEEQQGNYESGLKHGYFTTKTPNDSIVTGYYSNNMKQGEFISKKNQIEKKIYFQNDQMVRSFNYEFNQKLSAIKYLCTYKDISLNNFLIKGLDNKQWVNQLCVDYYITLVHDFYTNVIIQNQQIILFNTITCQDIFSDKITSIQPSNIKLEQYQKQIFQEPQKYNRIIFLLNVDRSHFITVVYRKNTLYLLNSQNSLQTDTKILNLIGSVFNTKPKFQEIEVEQQRNGYDCSMHSIYNALLQYKFYFEEVQNINYKINDYSKISKMRNQIKSVLLNNSASLFLN